MNAKITWGIVVLSIGGLLLVTQAFKTEESTLSSQPAMSSQSTLSSIEKATAKSHSTVLPEKIVRKQL